MTVYSSSSFARPSTTVSTSVSLAGNFSRLSFTIPPGAWPPALTTGLSVSVFDLPYSVAGAPGELLTGAGGQVFTVMGPAVDLGPEGFTFSPPIVISCPFTPGDSLLAGKDVRVFKYDSAAKEWIAIAKPSDAASPVDYTKGFVRAETSSFSPYVAVAVTPPPTAPSAAPQSTASAPSIDVSTPPPPAESGGGLSREGGVALGISLGAVGVVVGVLLAYRYLWARGQVMTAKSVDAHRKELQPSLNVVVAHDEEGPEADQVVKPRSLAAVTRTASDERRVTSAREAREQESKAAELRAAKMRLKDVMQEVLSVTAGPSEVFQPPRAQLGFVEEKHG